MYDITAEELFSYLLKDRMAHKRQMLDDIEQGNLSPDAINSELLATNKVITDNDSLDSDLDYIDSVLGDPQVEPAEDWLENAVAEQIDKPKVADSIYNNLREASDFNDLQDTKREAHVTRDMEGAKINRDTVRLERMLYNINKDNFLSDSEKVDMALRLLFNYNTRRYGMYPEDIRLSQNDIWKQLMLNEEPNENIDWYQNDAFTVDPKHKKLKMINEPNFMEKERIISDAVPLSYTSDKDNDIGQLFTPSFEANTVYDIFANAFTNAIKNNNAPELGDIGKYINDTYHNRLKTMTYSDWEKELAKETTPIDIKRIIEQVYTPEGAKISTGSALGDDIAWRVKNKRLAMEKEAGYTHDRHLPENDVRGMVEAYLVAADDDLDVPDDALTIEDWTEFLPDNTRLINKSKEEKEDNKLNRWHKDDKKNYKKYLKYREATADNPDLPGIKDTTEPTNDAYRNMVRTSKIENIKESIKQHIKDSAADLYNEFNSAVAAGHNNKANELADTISMYKEILAGSDEGNIELDNWARRVKANRERKQLNLKKKDVINTTSTVNSLFKDSDKLWLEEDAEGNVNPRPPKTEFERDAYRWLEAMQKRWNKYNVEKLEDEIEAKEIEAKQKSNGKSAKEKEDWEKDLVDMEEEHGRK